MRYNILALAIGTAALLSGCGGGASSGESSGSSQAAQGSDAAMPSDWKATDACSIIDKAAIESVLGVKVTDSSLSGVHEATPGAGDAATSECSYVLTEGRASVLTRWSPIADNTSEVIDMSRKATNETLKGLGGGTVDDVAGVGKASLWVEKVGQLQSFIGEDRMVLITVPSGPGAKDKAIALAKKAGA